MYFCLKFNSILEKDNSLYCKSTYIILLVILSSSIFSQPSNFIKLPKPIYAPGGYDTVGQKVSTQIATENLGIIEKEIDPQTYIVGPNDVLSISILQSVPLLFDAIVSPDGRVLIQGIGAVSVRGQTFAEAEKTILSAIQRVYKSEAIAVTLKKLKLFKVSVIGAVRKPTIVSASSMDRVSEVIERAGGLMFNASTRKIVIQRENGSQLKVDLLKYFTLGDDLDNPYVHGGDKIFIPFLNEIESILIQGDVRQQGLYEYLDKDSLFLMLKFAQGTSPQSMIDSVEVVRFDERGEKTISLFINANDFLLNKPSNSNIPLKIGDKIYVRMKSDVLTTREVAIDGGVKHPGRYAINNETDRLSDVILRAGGYTEDASPEAGLLIRRKDIYFDREIERLSKLEPMQMTEREARYYRTKVNENLGLVSIDFTKIFQDKSNQNNPILYHLDSIFIPKARRYINVIGRVNQPGRIVYELKLQYTDYIRKAGGLGYNADEDEIFVQKPNGEQHKAKDLNYQLEPGDLILVPDKPDVKTFDIFMKALTITSQLATIVGVVLSVVIASSK